MGIGKSFHMLNQGAGKVLSISAAYAWHEGSGNSSLGHGESGSDRHIEDTCSRMKRTPCTEQLPPAGFRGY